MQGEVLQRIAKEAEKVYGTAEAVKTLFSSYHAMVSMYGSTAESEWRNIPWWRRMRMNRERFIEDRTNSLILDGQLINESDNPRMSILLDHLHRLEESHK